MAYVSMMFKFWKYALACVKHAESTILRDKSNAVTSDQVVYEFVIYYMTNNTITI